MAARKEPLWERPKHYKLVDVTDVTGNGLNIHRSITQSFNCGNLCIGLHAKCQSYAKFIIYESTTLHLDNHDFIPLFVRHNIY